MNETVADEELLARYRSQRRDIMILALAQNGPVAYTPGGVIRRENLPELLRVLRSAYPLGGGP